MNKKQYNSIVKITWSGVSNFANNKKEARRFLKQTFLEHYGIELNDKEIVQIKEEK